MVSEKKYILFYIAFVLYCIAAFFDALHKSAFSFLPIVLMCNYLRLLSAMIAYVSYFKQNKSAISLLIAVVFVILLPWYFKTAYSSQIYASLALMLAAKDVKFDVIVDLLIKYLSTALIVAVVFSVLGIVPNEFQYREVPLIGAWKSYYLGFHYYSTPAYYGMTLVFMLLYKKRLNCSYLYLTFLIGLSLLVYVVSFARLQIFLNFVVFIAYVVSYKWHWITFEGKIWKYFSMTAFALMTMVVVFLSFSLLLLSDSSFFEFVNEWTNTRMFLNIQAFLTYDINLFGNLIEIKTRDLMPGENYFYIDSGFVSFLLSYGVVFYVFLLVMYGRAFYKIWKCNCKYLYILFSVYSIANISNNFMLGAITCPVTFLLFADMGIQDSLYEGNMRKLRKLKQLLILKYKGETFLA